MADRDGQPYLLPLLPLTLSLALILIASLPLSCPRALQSATYSPNSTFSFSPTAAAYSLRSASDNSASSESSIFDIRLWLQRSLAAS